MSVSIAAVLFILCLLAAIVETVAAMVWWPWYFRSAPRLWRVEVPTGAIESPPELAIADCVNRGAWRPLVFKRLSDGEVAFRESFASFRIGTALSGLITENATGGDLTITTRCSWFLVLGLVLAAQGAIVEHDSAAVGVGLVLLGLLAAQRYRLSLMRRAIEPRHPVR